jgi:hypothetical protein
MAQINAEFGRGNNLNAYRGTTYYTSSGGPFTFSSGAISFSDFYGTQVNSPSFSFTIASNQANANLRSLALAAGWNGSSVVTATVNAGVYIYSNTVGTPALTINGSWPGGVTLVNNGLIMGQGGQGGGFYQFTAAGGAITYTPNYLQSAGSAAISLGVSCTIQNNSYIAGGGGAGGSVNNTSTTAGGGAGGGIGGTYRARNENVSPATDTIVAGGAGGGLGGSGSNGASNNVGGGGGRVLPGTNITLTAASNTGSPNSVATSTGGGANNAGSATAVLGSGSTGSSQSLNGLGGTAGGTGGAYAGVGQYLAFCYAGGGGGGWGASGSASAATGGQTANAGSAGGNCVALNGYSVTWTANGTRYGAIS